jgi:ribosomal RNA-processing protein 9
LKRGEVFDIKLVEMRRTRATSMQQKKGKGPAAAPRSAVQLSNWDEDVESSDDDDNEGRGRKKGRTGGDKADSDREEEMETAEQKRRRLAKEYLSKIRDDDEDEDDEEEGDNEDDEDDDGAGKGRPRADRISDSLRRDRLEKQGKYFRNLASGAETLDVASLTTANMSDHDLSVTCVALASDESVVYSGSKDNSVIMWDLESGSRRVLRPKWSRSTHGSEQCCKGEVLSVAVTSDGRYLASGGRDTCVRIFDTRMSSTEVQAFKGHRDAVTSLAFRRDSYSLFSGSLDRCLKHWDLNEMGYLETLFGHQDGVTAVDCWTKERPVSASSDRTIRLWKVSDETHLIFRGHKSTPDAVQIMTEDSCLTGGQDGSLNLWKETQKKPVKSAVAAHGHDDASNPNWICSIGAVKMSDIAATGSCDGKVRLWNVSSENRRLEQISQIPLLGFVNSVAISSRLVVAGTGREHRFGRWWNMRGNRNKVTVFRLPHDLDAGSKEKLDSSDDDDDEDKVYDDDDDEEEEEEEEG